MNLTGIIFDFDGTLVDSMGVWATATSLYLREAGKEPHPDVDEQVKRLSLSDTAVFLKEMYGLSQSLRDIMDGINRQMEVFYRELVCPKPYANELLVTAHRKGINMAIATATDRSLIESALTCCGWGHYFQDIITCHEVGYGKQYPQVFDEAQYRLGTPKAETVVWEDAFHAIETAKRAGYTVVGVADTSEPYGNQAKQVADYWVTNEADARSFWAWISAWQEMRWGSDANATLCRYR